MTFSHNVVQSKTKNILCCLGFLVCLTTDALADDCTGNQATNEKSAAGQYLYVQQGQTFHVNADALSGLSAAQFDDIKAGIASWAGTAGITITFDNSPPGFGVVTLSKSSSIDSTGHTSYSYGGSDARAANQITGGTIEINLGYISTCASGPCPAFDPNAPNADLYLKQLGAHEMGHMLGLYEPIDAQSPSSPCSQTSISVLGGSCGTNNNGDGMSKPAPTSSTPTPCDKTNVSNQSANFSGGGGGPTGGGDGSGGDGGGSCNYYYYQEYDDSTERYYTYVVEQC